jgi:hypothetical protein
VRVATPGQLLEPKAPARYYTPWQVLVGTLIGGPLAGGFLIAADHSAFGAAARGRAVLVVSCLVIVGTVLLQGTGAGRLQLEDAAMVAGLVAGLYGVYARVALAADITRRHGTGWVAHPWARVLGISFGFCAAILLLLSLAAPNLGGPS